MVFTGQNSNFDHRTTSFLACLWFTFAAYSLRLCCCTIIYCIVVWGMGTDTVACYIRDFKCYGKALLWWGNRKIKIENRIDQSSILILDWQVDRQNCQFNVEKNKKLYFQSNSIPMSTTTYYTYHAQSIALIHTAPCTRNACVFGNQHSQHHNRRDIDQNQARRATVAVLCEARQPRWSKNVWSLSRIVNKRAFRKKKSSDLFSFVPHEGGLWGVLVRNFCRRGPSTTTA